MKHRYNIMLNPKLVYYIDCICNDNFNKISRSEFINGLIAQYVFDRNLSDTSDLSEVCADKVVVEEL